MVPLSSFSSCIAVSAALSLYAFILAITSKVAVFLAVVALNWLAARPVPFTPLLLTITRHMTLTLTIVADHGSALLPIRSSMAGAAAGRHGWPPLVLMRRELRSRPISHPALLTVLLRVLLALGCIVPLKDGLTGCAVVAPGLVRISGILVLPLLVVIKVNAFLCIAILAEGWRRAVNFLVRVGPLVLLFGRATRTALPARRDCEPVRLALVVL